MEPLPDPLEDRQINTINAPPQKPLLTHLVFNYNNLLGFLFFVFKIKKKIDDEETAKPN